VTVTVPADKPLSETEQLPEFCVHEEAVSTTIPPFDPTAENVTSPVGEEPVTVAAQEDELPIIAEPGEQTTPTEVLTGPAPLTVRVNTAECKETPLGEPVMVSV